MEKSSEYNNEPVCFCKKCLSLKVLRIDDEDCYCEDCGSTDIGQTSIEDWDIRYQKMYGHKFLDWKNPNHKDWTKEYK